MRINQNLTMAETALKRRIAAACGLRSRSGPHPGEGNAAALDRAIVAGRVAVIAITDTTPDLLAWLEDQRGETEALWHALDALIASILAAYARQEKDEG